MNNIAEILKDAPKGLELYSTVYGHVKFTDLKDTNIQEKAIAVVDEDGVNRYFSENGYLSRHGEMLLFPSYHEYINGYGWENWGNSLLPRSIGSVVVDEDFEGLFLITSKNTLCDSAGMEFETLWKRLRYATKEESERFFGNLEYHGYRYDNELKKVFNIKCEFQIGDTIRRKDNKETFKIVGKDITVYTPPVSPTFKLSNGDWISFQALKENYVLVENTADNSKDTQNQCERFTINDFHPFDKVLVRINQDEWHIEFFERINRDGDTGIDYYTCLYDTYRQCVPYNEETQHLLGTTEEYDGKYKTW